LLATDIDPGAVRCARGNGVDALEGHLFEPLPPSLRGSVDVVTAVAPYVPTAALPLLPRDTLVHEPRRALDGGPDGLATVRLIVVEVQHWLRSGGWLVLELGADQVPAASEILRADGWRGLTTILDPEGEACGLAAQQGGARRVMGG
jgi:release factor glutamine methyltransferase